MASAIIPASDWRIARGVSALPPAADLQLRQGRRHRAPAGRGPDLQCHHVMSVGRARAGNVREPAEDRREGATLLQDLRLEARDLIVVHLAEMGLAGIDAGNVHGLIAQIGELDIVAPPRSEEHTSELQSRFGISY